MPKADLNKNESNQIESDWKELHKWEKEQAQLKIENEELNDCSERGLEKAEKTLNRVDLTINLLIGIAFIIAIIIIIIQWISINRSFDDNNDIGKFIKDVYSDNKIILREIQVDENGFGLYSAFFEKDPNVEFLIYQDKETNLIYEDSMPKYRQYYLGTFDNAEIKQSLTIEKETMNFYEHEFLIYYEFWIEIKDYDDIEEATRKLYELCQYLNQTAKEPSMLLLRNLIRKGAYKSPEFILDYNISYEEFLQNEQNAYKEYH